MTLHKMILLIVGMWLLIGCLMVARSQSRGPFADTVFILTWPVHVVLHLLGRDGS